ncbi:MAG: hypothetical protein ACKODW_01650 [Methylophilaceae bacterium]|jgi:hypothetical protein|nr:hypothetical protein [Methylophilaceae bacterium]
MNVSYRNSQRYWHIRIDSIFARAILASLLLHALVIFLFLPNIRQAPLDLNIRTLDVRLVPLPTAKSAMPEVPKLKQEEAIEQVVKPKKEKTLTPSVKKLMTSPNSEDRIIPITPHPEKPVLEKTPIKETPQANDLLAYLNARRQQRQAQEMAEKSPSTDANIQDRLVPEQKRDEIIARNLQQEGTNGLFQIREIVGDSAQFTFRGWQQNGRNTRFEIVTVLAGPNETIERAIVRKMIAIIREHYSGDFNWQSQKYGRIIVLSARPQDNQALEDFMIQEFFAMSGR